MYTNDTGSPREVERARGLARWIQSRSCIKLNINNSGLWSAGRPRLGQAVLSLYKLRHIPTYLHLLRSKRIEDHNTPSVRSFVARSSVYCIRDIYAPHSTPLNKQDHRWILNHQQPRAPNRALQTQRISRHNNGHHQARGLSTALFPRFLFFFFFFFFMGSYVFYIIAGIMNIFEFQLLCQVLLQLSWKF